MPAALKNALDVGSRPYGGSVWDKKPGAIVSLATVLGRAGVLNNPTHWVTAVVPSDNASRPPNEMDADKGSKFKFALMPADLLPSLASPDAFSKDALEPYAAVMGSIAAWLALSAVGFALLPQPPRPAAAG